MWMFVYISLVIVQCLQFFPESRIESHLPFDGRIPLLQCVHRKIFAREIRTCVEVSYPLHDCEGGGGRPNGGAGGVTVMANDAAYV
jgi:hypothetical protein